MISDQNWIIKVQSLPLERQREVLDFIEFLSQREIPSTPRPSTMQTLWGLWADLNVDLDDEAIQKVL